MGKICLIVGTRPEIIKVAPVVMEFMKRGFQDFLLINTGQHRDMSDPYWSLFGLKPDYNLSIMVPGSSLGQLTSRAFEQLDGLFNELQKNTTIDAVLAQGDTTTVMVSSVLSFYRKIPFVHLEAGLRSDDIQNPFPEEFNRKVTTIVTRLHLAPTLSARNNLIKEGVAADKIEIIGNTVVDALNYVRKSPAFTAPGFSNEKLNAVFDTYSKHVLITCHRRENQGANLIELMNAVVSLGTEHQDTLFVWPVHPNPNVKGKVFSNSNLTQLKNILLVDPLEYLDIIKVLSKCHKVISDSGGIQEEAPSFKVPVLVLRSATERNEAIEAGVSKLVAPFAHRIIDDYCNFTPSFGANFQNPFGDGLSSGRAAALLINLKKKI